MHEAAKQLQDVANETSATIAGAFCYTEWNSNSLNLFFEEPPPP